MPNNREFAFVVISIVSLLVFRCRRRPLLLPLLRLLCLRDMHYVDFNAKTKQNEKINEKYYSSAGATYQLPVARVNYRRTSIADFVSTKFSTSSVSSTKYATIFLLSSPRCHFGPNINLRGFWYTASIWLFEQTDGQYLPNMDNDIFIFLFANR